MIRYYSSRRGGMCMIDSQKAASINQIQISFAQRPSMKDGYYFLLGIKLKLVKVEAEYVGGFLATFEVPKEYDPIDILNVLADSSHRFNNPRDAVPLFSKTSGT